MSKRREIVVSTDALIEQYINEYAQCGNPIRVNFRTLVPELNRTERYTHLTVQKMVECHRAYLLTQHLMICLSSRMKSK